MCHKIKNISLFTPSKRGKYGRHCICRECRNLYARKKFAEHPELRRKYKKTYADKYPIKEWCRAAIGSHKRKGYIVKFGVKELLSIAEKTSYCKYCNNKLDYDTKYGKRKNIPKENNPTIDRINGEKILTVDNVEIICWKCNTTKLNRTEEEFYKYSKQIYNKLKNKYEVIK